MSDGLFSAIKISASGLRGQRTKMDVVARNLANAETTRTADGTPYRRQRAIFEQVLGEKLQRHSLDMGYGVESRMTRTHPGHMAESGNQSTSTVSGVSSEVAEDVTDDE